MNRWSRARRALNAWAKGPETPTGGDADYYYWATYVKGRAKFITLLGYVAVLAVAALLPYLLWGVVAQRAVVGLAALAYWPAAWHFYMRHHFKPQYRRAADNER